eukprot:SAG22_NODE_120_length_19227_cov_7.584013_16_plen_1054_part_00
MGRRIGRKKDAVVGADGGAAAQVDAWATTREREFDSDDAGDSFDNPISNGKKNGGSGAAGAPAGFDKASFLSGGTRESLAPRPAAGAAVIDDDDDDMLAELMGTAIGGSITPSSTGVARESDFDSREKDFDTGPSLRKPREKPAPANVNGAMSPQAVPTGEHHSAAQMISANKMAFDHDSESPDDMADLRHAFMAADMDGNAWIDTEEFIMMLKVIGCEISKTQVKQLIDDAKDGFLTWKRMADSKNRDKCKQVWEEYDADKSGTMDMEEISSIVENLKDFGFRCSSLPEEEDMSDGVLNFEEFCSWFLQQEGLPDEFCVPDQGLVAGRVLKNSKNMMKSLTSKLVGRGGAAPEDLLKASTTVSTRDRHGVDDQVEELLHDHSKLIFAEFVFMMRGDALEQYMPGDWQDRAADMIHLREAFDVIDVDGNNELEMDELEMVIISMNPRQHVSTAEVSQIWSILNPTGKKSISFPEFVAGYILVKKDPVLGHIMRTDVPNRFQLLSLICDTPVNEEEEHALFENVSALEKLGFKMLKKINKSPPTRDQVRETLQQACAGKLHFLTKSQRRSVKLAHIWCCVQAALIAVVWTGLPGVVENILVWKFETDGVVDAYWTCPATIGDPDAAPWGQGNLTLATCEPGLCTSIPDMNASEYLAMGGSKTLGGNWSGDECTPLLHTFTHSHEVLYIFWALNLTSIVVCIVFELSLLMYTAVRSAVLMSSHIDLRLTPINRDRAFVANMLVRTCFELGDPEGELMGVDTEKEQKHHDRPLILDILAVLFIKGKVVITGALFKFITSKMVSYDTATWLKPYSGTMLACVLWDSLICHAIMRKAQIRAIGVTTSIEVFNDIVDTFCPMYETDTSSLSEAAKIQFLRAIGVAIVKHGSMFPTMEILLRHAANYLGMRRHPAITQVGIIDDEQSLLADFDKLSLPESRAVLCIHMLCYVLDGSAGFSELTLWGKLCARVEELHQEERARFDDLDAVELRAWICTRSPYLANAVERVPVGERADKPDDVQQRLDDDKQLMDVWLDVDRDGSGALDQVELRQVFMRMGR